MGTAPTHVHLVHGTWPHGPFGKSDPAKPKWFEQRAQPAAEPPATLAEQLRARLPVLVAVEPFLWSGRNGFAARTWAAVRLAERITAVATERPDVRQVIVAHSHGGSAAVQAMTYLIEKGAEQSLAACICMGTPFAYVIDRDRVTHGGPTELGEALGNTAATGFFLAALAGGSFGRPLAWTGHVLLLVAGFALAIIVQLAFDRLSSPDHHGRPEVLPHVEMLILRSPRDEASLALGLAQAARWLSDTLYGAGESGGFLRMQVVRLVVLALPSLAALPFLLPYVPAIRQSSPVAPFVACVAGGLMLLSLVHITAHVLGGMATGLLNPFKWARTGIEVELVPPNHPCTVKSYSSLYQDTFTRWAEGNLSSRRRGLRHSEITQSREAIADIAAAIEAVHAGRPVEVAPGKPDDWLFDFRPRR